MWIAFMMLHVGTSIFYVCKYLKTKENKMLYQTILVSFIPIAGLIFVLTTEYISEKAALKNEQLSMDFFEDYQFELIKKSEFESNLNAIPLEEALLINDNSIKRKMVRDILKKDAIRHIKQLKIALKDNDPETSHYAAAAILEIKKNYENTLYSLVEKYQENQGDIANSIVINDEYCETLYRYICTDLLDKNNKNKYQKILINKYELAIILRKRNNEDAENKDVAMRLAQKSYSAMIKTLIELKEYDKAEIYCKQFIQDYQNAEETYFLLLGLYHMSNKREDFIQTLETIKSNSIIFSNRGVSTLRFWIGGNLHELVQKNAR